MLSDWSTDDSKALNSKLSSLVPINLIRTDKGTILKKFKRHTYVLNETYFSRKVRPATSVVIGISSNETLKPVLSGLKGSIWWNHEARFLLVHKNFESSCDMGQTNLKTLWNFNVLSVTYLCRKSNNESSLYSFNPYANVAPKFWKGKS